MFIKVNSYQNKNIKHDISINSYDPYSIMNDDNINEYLLSNVIKSIQ